MALRLLLGAALLLGATAARSPPSKRAFLQKELPLSIVVTTPVELATGAASDGVNVVGRQALTVVFSRPVIALGSDFGDSTATKKAPFSLGRCNIPGKFRWVTTTIFRFDPDVDWPTDLACDLVWATGLTTYDGAPLDLGTVPRTRPLTSYPLSMNIGGVTSALAANLTDGLWSASTATPAELPYEVPSDGRIQVYFSYPVNLIKLKSALQIAEGRKGDGAAVSFDLGPCQTAAPWIYAVAGSSATTPAGLSLDVNTTCAEVVPTSALKPNTSYLLRLPRGAVYSALAGPLRVETSFGFGGLLPFKFPFLDNLGTNPFSGISYRRLTLWLRHGLSADTTIQSLAKRIRVCAPSKEDASCADLAFSASLDSRGKARLSVPELAPGVQYKIIVAQDDAVKDGFGQGLQASSLTFWAGYVNHALATPTTNYQVAVLEAGADPLAAWPVVTRGPPPNNPWNRGWQPTYPSSISSWELDLSSDLVKALVIKAVVQGYAASMSLDAAFGAPASRLDLPDELRTPGSGAGWAELQLPLGGAAGPFRARLLMTCCDERGFPTTSKLLLNSSLSLSIVQGGGSLTAWVLDTATGEAAAGAVVSVFSQPYAYQADPMLFASCTADEDGVCVVSALSSDSPYMNLAAFASKGDQFALLTSSGFTRPPEDVPVPYVASLVADRAVIVPGDSLKVTGFVQSVSQVGLALPPTSYAVLEVSPGFQASADSSSGASGGGTSVRPVGRRLLGEQSVFAAAAAAVTRDAAVAVDEYEAAVATEAEVAVGEYTDEATFGTKAAVSAGDAMPGKLVGGGIGGGWPGTSTPVLPPARFLVQINGATGTLHGEIPVPADARLQKYTVSLRIPAVRVAAMDLNGAIAPAPLGSEPDVAEADNWLTVPSAALGFTVADPRPPTAELKLEVPPWVLPTGLVTVRATAVSYIGASVKDATISVVWKHAKASGLLKLVTDAAGAASATLDLGALPEANRTTAYDTLSLGAEWIGPTRERITQGASVKLADGPARLALQLSLAPDAPGTAFAVAATLTSNVDGSAIAAAPVTVTLRPAPGDPGAGAACAEAPGCSTTTGAGFVATCQLALPCVGRFELKACAAVPGSAAPACASQLLGRNASEWAAAPLAGHVEPDLSSDKTTYAQGEQAKLTFQNPWPAARLLLLWGNNLKMASKVVNTLPASSLVEVSIPLGAECTGGCTVMALLSVPRLSAAQLPLPPADQLPISRLFDPRAPHTHDMRLALDVRPPNALGVAVAVAAEAGTPTVQDADGEEVVAIEPGAQAQITVTVTAAPGSAAPPADSVEVTVYAVDKAFLDLLPYPLPQPEQDMVLQLAAEVSHYGTSAYFLAPGSVRAVYDKLMARLTGQDPWLPVETFVGTGGNGGYFPTDYNVRPPPSYALNVPAVDRNDTEYLAGFSSPLTSLPYIGYYYGSSLSPSRQQDNMMSDVTAGGGSSESWSPAERVPAPAPSDANKLGGPTSTTTSSAVSVRSSADFVVTPLFATLAASAGGLAAVTFTAPQNLGAFVIRAFASSGASAKYGAAEGRLAVRRRLSLTPSVPRFVRVGDVFEAGVVVTVGSAPASISVTVKLVDADASPLTLTASVAKSATFTSGGGLQQEVRFSFSAASIGSAALTFSATDGQPGGASDALKLEIPVEGQQGDVWVATSFAIAALPAQDDTALVQWQEGMDLPAAVPGSGGLSLTAGVGYFPALASLYDNLLGQDEDSTYPYGQLATLWATLPAVWSYYGQPTSKPQGAAVAKGFADLAKLTHPTFGLQWTDYTRWSSWTPTRADLSINTWALWLAAEHGAAASTAEYADEWAKLAGGSIPTWRAAVERQIVADAQEAQYSWDGTPGNYSDWNTLAWVRLVLGGDWVAPSSESVRNDLSLATLLKNTKAMGRETRVVLSLVLLQMGAAAPSPALVNATVLEVTSALRVQGRTAYVAAAPGAASAASLDEQALCLLLLLRAGATHQLLPKLAAYVANPSATSGWGMFSVRPSWGAQGLAAAALSEYDRARGSASPDVDLSAEVNGLDVLTASFVTGGSMAPVVNTTAWELIPDAPAGKVSELNFQAVGRGEVSVAASLHFVPVALLAFPTYRGIYVEAALQMVDRLTGAPTGQRVSAVPLGSTVALTVQLTTADDLGAVTLSVLMPGGLEALDPNVATGLAGGCGASAVDSYAFSSFYRWWWWPVCPSQETRPSLVTFSYMRLSAGTSSVTITAVAASVGTFVLPPIRASADDQPEVMGLTAGGKFTVCAACAGPTYGSPPPPPKPCPSDCSGNGVCNLKTGTCQCDPAFRKSDCSSAVA